VSDPSARALLITGMSTHGQIPALGDRVRVSGTESARHVGVAGTVTGLEPDVHYDGTPAVTVTLLTGERVWGHPDRFTTDPLPREATWNDYVTAHGGPEASGWWVTLAWFADSPYPRPEVVGPYSSYDEAVTAMEDSLLIDGFAADTNRSEVLDDVYVATNPASITRMCAEYGARVTLIDPTDPTHFGDREPTAPARADPRSGVLQATALHARWSGAVQPEVDGAVDPSPVPPGR
jgi:hypothetical protein